MTASIFSGVHSFFHSATWDALRVVLIAFVVLLWLATIYWVFKDAHRRIDDGRLVALAMLVGAVPPFIGPMFYMLFRPPEYLEDVRERELEIKAIESRLGGPELKCTVCGCEVEHDFLVCPVCTTKLRSACTECSRPLEPAWQVCPYCETPVTVGEPVALAPRPGRRRSSTSSSG
ncbi:MAG TPA: zinc ribbon domain-containing protein [Gaiellaceae bacterium]